MLKMILFGETQLDRIFEPRTLVIVHINRWIVEYFFHHHFKRFHPFCEFYIFARYYKGQCTKYVASYQYWLLFLNPFSKRFDENENKNQNNSEMISFVFEMVIYPFDRAISEKVCCKGLELNWEKRQGWIKLLLKISAQGYECVKHCIHRKHLEIFISFALFFMSTMKWITQATLQMNFSKIW